MDELAARQRAVLHRPDIAPAQAITFGSLAFQPGHPPLHFIMTCFTCDGVFFALAALVKAKGKGVLRKTLISEVYGLDDEAAPMRLRGICRASEPSSG